MDEYTVIIAFDDEAQKWYAQNDDIPIILEDYSVDTLISRVKLAAPEMLELNNKPHTGINLVFKSQKQKRRQRDIEIINANAKRFNKQAEENLKFQAVL